MQNELLAPAADSPTPLVNVSASWEGMSSDFTLEPPDPCGAAGPDGILQTVNLRVEYWNKNGTRIWGPVADATFWASAGINGGNLLSDPHTLFDRASGRFYTVLLEVDESANKSYLNVAVSKTSNPISSGTSDWYFYRIDDTEVSGGTRYWTDYPGLGVDGQAVYVTYNMYSFPVSSGYFKNAVIIVLNKANFNSGTTNYSFVYTPDASGAFTLQPCTVLGSSSPNNVAYFAETPLVGNFSTSVRIWALSNPLGSRTLTSTNVTVPFNGGPPPYSGAPQPGTSIPIDTLDGRTQGNAFWYNGSVWFCTTAGGSSGKSLAYYYQVNLNNYPAGTPTLGQSGFIDGGPGEWTYQPSIGGNSRGDIGIVYCQSSATRYPTIFAATRGNGAPSFGTPVLVKASPGYYYGGRWGDYGSVTSDPADESFWVTHEWAKTTQPGAWSTWWAQIAAPPSYADGILEVAVTPASGSTLVEGTTQAVFVAVTDASPVTNATVVATVNGGTNLVFRNDGIAPDATANDGIYSANLGVPPNTNDLTLDFLITAPNKTNSNFAVTYSVVPVPVNDYFTNATKVPPGGAVYLSNNKFATLEPGEPQHAGVASVAASLWWSWSPSSTKNAFFDTTGSAIDTVLAVYTGTSVNNLTPVAATNDVGTSKQAYLNVNVTAGATYRIVVASANSNSVGSLRLVIAPGGQQDTNAPTVFVASPLSGLWVTNFLITVTGTASDPQPNASGVTRVLLSVNGQLPTTASGTTNWSSTFGLIPGLNTITVVAEDLAGNISAPVTIYVSRVIINPVNDLFANAIPLQGNSGMVSAITTNATKEYGEPNHAGNAGGKSVWWSFVAPADGVLNLSTTNSSFDTLLGLYTGSLVSQLTTVASNDDAYVGVPGGFSQIVQAVRSNLTYYIAVDGFDGVGGNAMLTYSFAPAAVYHLTTGSLAGGSVYPGSGDYASNSTVQVTATPDQFFQFANWSGSSTATANPLSVILSSNVSVTASFVPMTFSDDFETGNLLKLPWTTSGNLPWVVQTNVVLAGQYSARSGAIGDSQTSSLILTTNFAGGNGSFYYKVSSELNWDSLNFYIDGVLQQQWSGEIDWTSFGFPLSAGTHTLEWSYVKDPSDSAGLDAAFLDNVSLPLSLPINSSTAASLSIFQQLDGSLLLQVLGQTNRQYVIQGATNLTLPVLWQNLSTNMATGGVINYPVAPSGPLRFYRAVVPVP